MVLNWYLVYQQKSDLRKCSKCQTQSEKLHSYSGYYESRNIVQKEEDPIQYNVPIRLYCGACLYLELQRIDGFFAQITKSLTGQIENLTKDKQNLNQSINDFEDIVEKYICELQNKDLKIAELEALTGNSENKFLTKELNLGEVSKLLICLQDLTKEVLLFLPSGLNLQYEDFENFKSSTQFAKKSFFQGLQSNTLNYLSQMQDDISKDIQSSLRNEDVLGQMQNNFLKQYEKEIEQGALEAQSFSNFMNAEKDKKRVSEKNVFLDKIQFIKEMVSKQFTIA